jgi:exodeoxyribonuclease VII small subunit
VSIEIPADTTFEQAQRELQLRVAQLESGDVGLDDAIRIFEEAMAYQRFCERRLTEIKGRIEELTASDLPAAGAQEAEEAGEPPF